MISRLSFFVTFVFWGVLPVLGQFDSGSDGSDGAFVFFPDVADPNVMTIDLNLAHDISLPPPTIHHS